MSIDVVYEAGTRLMDGGALGAIACDVEMFRKLLDEEMAKPDVQQINTPRHTITVDDFSFRARLKKELSRAQIA